LYWGTEMKCPSCGSLLESERAMGMTVVHCTVCGYEEYVFRGATQRRSVYCHGVAELTGELTWAM
jgi:DNA-directed RNA polymerase subunit M/transcription elongation factor TFIIS